MKSKFSRKIWSTRPLGQPSFKAQFVESGLLGPPIDRPIGGEEQRRILQKRKNRT